MIGKTLGHYEIIGKLGSGGMGDVYRGRDTKLDRELAIKVLPAHLAEDQDRRSRFTREAQAVAKLKHPNIITIHSVEEVDGVHFLTMEFVEGDTLAAMIPRDGLDTDRFFTYTTALADAVSAAHDEGITHRDLKPANIMFDKGGRLKVLDFGLAKLLEETTATADDPTIMQSGHTLAGQILGTAAYMSPEQAEGKPIDHRSDIFSLGILFYEMASGRRPFQGDTHISTITSVLRDTPQPITEIRQNLPRHLGRIINRCLEKDPDRRYQTAKDVRNELEDLKKEMDSGIISPTTSATSFIAPPPESKRSKPWLPWAIGAAAVVAVAVAFWAFRQPESNRPAETRAAPTTSVAQTPAAPATDKTDDRKMMVVLPFENLGPAEEAYFAAGMTEEITSRLSTVSGLGVISRTSATQYDRTGKTMRQIADDLGVDFVVEGTVRWARSADGTDRVRITPQLIRVSDDTPVWSETYDRQIDDIFEVQSDIASHVIDQLGVTLLGSERDNLETAPTQNVAAYQLYLQARDLKEPNWDKYDQRAVELLEEAVALDPGFIQAWSRLSQHHSGWYSNGLDKTEERLSKARFAMQKADAIDPDHAYAHLARGTFQYLGFRNYDQALEEFLAASRLVPNDAHALEMVAYIYRRQGKWEEHLDRLTAAFELDPRSENIAGNLAGSYRAMRRFEEAQGYNDLVLELDPQNMRARLGAAYTMISWKGDLDAAREILREKPEQDSAWYHFGWIGLHAMSGEYAEAIEQARLADDGTPFLHALSVHIMSSIAARAKIDNPELPTLEEAGRLYEALLAEMPSNAGLRSGLAMNLALRGQSDAAVQEAKLAVNLEAKDAFEGPSKLENLAQVYAEVGRHDEAIDLLERLLKTVYEDSITLELLKINPDWDPLREHPRFNKLFVTS